MLLPGAFQQTYWVRHLRAADDAKLHSGLTQNNGANKTSVSWSVAVADDPAWPIDLLMCIRQHRPN